MIGVFNTSVDEIADLCLLKKAVEEIEATVKRMGGVLIENPLMRDPITVALYCDAIHITLTVKLKPSLLCEFIAQREAQDRGSK